MGLGWEGDLLLPRFRPLLSEAGWRYVQRSVQIAVANGAVQGLALVVLLPGAASLASGGPAWGLPFGGWLLLLAVLALVGAVLEYRLAINGYASAIDFVRFSHRRLGDMIARIPLGWFGAGVAGRFSRMVSKEMIQLGQTLAHMAFPLVTNLTALAVVLVGSWVWDWRLGLVLTVAAPVLYLLLGLSRWLLAQGKRISEPAELELADRVVEFAICQGALRSCGRAGHVDQLDEAVARSHQAGRRELWWGLGANLIPGAASQLIVVSLLVVAAWLATAGRLGPVETIAFMGMALRFMGVLESIQIGIIGLAERRSLMDQMDEVVSAPLLSEPDRSAALPRPGAVRLSHVDFAYVPGQPVLRDVSIDVPPRTMCALVGPSGSGKTTVARLVARFWEAGSGVVEVGGVDVRDLTTKDLMAQLSMVFQDVYLFDDTLAANIRVGDPDASAADVAWAAGLAGVDEIVARLPHGYETRVGEGGRALSGGERQRVSVARALLKRSPVVLLDEATSALDAENEANLVAAMQELRKTSTLLVIAHKLDTIEAADQIVVLDAEGRVAQVGTHDDLVVAAGPYRGFWTQRERAAGWQLV